MVRGKIENHRVKLRQSGCEMLRAAAGAKGSMRLAAVTVLTSHTPESFGEAVGRNTVELHQEVSRLARLAVASGIKAVVVSPWELGTMRLEVAPGGRRGY